MADGNRTFLLVPAAGAGEGMGHLVRSMKLAAALGPRVSFLTTRMDSPARALLAEELRHFPRHPRPVMLEKLPSQGRWDILLVDARRTTREELSALMPHGLVVCVDEGGEARRYAPFLVDAIPGLPGTSPANLTSPAFLDLPARRKKPLRLPPRRVLLSFGGEDRQGLSRKLVEALLREELFAPRGPHDRGRSAVRASRLASRRCRGKGSVRACPRSPERMIFCSRISASPSSRHLPPACR